MLVQAFSLVPDGRPASSFFFVDMLARRADDDGGCGGWTCVALLGALLVLATAVEAPRHTALSTPVIALDDALTAVPASRLWNATEARCVSPFVITTSQTGAAQVFTGEARTERARDAARTTSATLALHAANGAVYADHELLSAVRKRLFFFEETCAVDEIVVRLDEPLVRRAWFGAAPTTTPTTA